MSFNYALANRWACCPSYSSSYTSLKHLGDTHGGQAEQLALLTVWGHLRHQLFLGFPLKSSHILWDFLQNQVTVLAHGKQDQFHQKGAGKAPNLNRQLSGALPSPYLCYLISVLFPKCLWHPVPSSLFPTPIPCPVSYHVIPEHHPLLRGGQTTSEGQIQPASKEWLLHF